MKEIGGIAVCRANTKSKSIIATAVEREVAYRPEESTVVLLRSLADFGKAYGTIKSATTKTPTQVFVVSPSIENVPDLLVLAIPNEVDSLLFELT